MIEKLAECSKMELAKGIENVDTKEMGEVAEMLKELCEAEYYATITKAMEESEYGEDYDMNGPKEERRYYRGRARDSMGRFKSRRGYDEMMGYEEMYPMEHYRDMDRDYGRMYYSGGGSGGSSSGSSGGSSGGSYGSSSGGGSMSGSMGSGNRNYGGDSGMRDYREGRSGMSRRSYMETKEAHPGNSSEDKQVKTKELEKYMNELSSDLTEMIAGASAEEKSVLKTKMQTLMQKIQ